MRPTWLSKMGSRSEHELVQLLTKMSFNFDGKVDG